ncbi:MAG: hypothetical protein EOO60_12765 [Hymenobacter sp.]|nr:MAG: hypothetical protein EOO60_12765 [Hymenobacter sp.]
MFPALRLSTQLLLAAGCLSFAPHPRPRPDSELILGTWISAEDKNWKLVFTKDKCTQYYSGQAPEVDHYALSNKSPQCGTKVPVESFTSYLQLTDSKHLTLCYEITSLDATNLAYRLVYSGKVALFKRKK